jgi:uncharacterized membrane protein HdeD (DUF308 family)
MFAFPGSLPDLGRTFTHDAAERLAANWWRLLLNGIVLIVAGVLIFSIDWSIRSLSTFIGALFIFEGVTLMLTTGFDRRVARANILSGLLSAAVGVAIIVWPEPGLVAVAIFLGSWLIVTGTLAVAGSFSARSFLPQWWLLLLTGVLEVALGVLALADPGATLAAIITVGGIWAVVVGVMRIITAFELKRLPDDVDRALVRPDTNGVSRTAKPDPGRVAPTGA